MSQVDMEDWDMQPKRDYALIGGVNALLTARETNEFHEFLMMDPVARLLVEDILSLQARLKITEERMTSRAIAHELLEVEGRMRPIVNGWLADCVKRRKLAEETKRKLEESNGYARGGIVSDVKDFSGRVVASIRASKGAL